eukprot:3951530-Karenia_brevis.AAC.1
MPVSHAHTCDAGSQGVCSRDGRRQAPAVSDEGARRGGAAGCCAAGCLATASCGNGSSYRGSFHGVGAAWSPCGLEEGSQGVPHRLRFRLSDGARGTAKTRQRRRRAEAVHRTHEMHGEHGLARDD